MAVSPDLFNRQPHKVLAFRKRHEAIAGILSPRAILGVDQLHGKYVEWIEGYSTPMRDRGSSPELLMAQRLGKFLAPYRDWPVSDFGPDELTAVRLGLVDHRYFRTNHDDGPVPYTRTGINQLINIVHKMWRWGVGREITTEARPAPCSCAVDAKGPAPFSVRYASFPWRYLATTGQLTGFPRRPDGYPTVAISSPSFLVMDGIVWQVLDYKWVSKKGDYALQMNLSFL